MSRLLLSLMALGAAASGYIFKPDNYTTYENSFLPMLVNLTDSQYPISQGSYWASAYITTTTGNQYFLISHILASDEPTCRSSLLDLHSLVHQYQFVECGTLSSSVNKSHPFNLELDGYGFASTSPDSISTMSTFGWGDEYQYDINWESSSKVLLNGGLGIFTFGEDLANTTEWGIPASKTTGSLVVNNQTEIIDEEKSLTWYDRQYTYGTPRNWTWFELHFPGSSTKASIWAYDFPEASGARFGTARVSGDSQFVLSYTLVPNMMDVWTSPNSNITYPLSWTLKFETGDWLFIRSVLADQEIYGPGAVANTVYEGFITVQGHFLGQSDGFGVVEMTSLY